MLVANSFDLWQKDTFFSAAEEVQQSADIMESSYRTWLRARTEGCQQEDLDELSRELQMALSTAKWQLEEFEKAVCMSHRSHRDDITVREGKKELHWVDLDEEECDDLALFLSGSTGTSKRNVNEAIGTSLPNKKISGKENSNLGSEVSSTIESSGEGRSPQKANEDAISISFYADGNASNRRTWSPSHKGALEIVIDKDDTQNNADIEATPKEKCTKPFFWNSRGEDHAVVKGGVLSPPQLNVINWINQVSLCDNSTLERMSQKSETTTDGAIVSSQFPTFNACFTADNFFSSAVFGVFDLNCLDQEAQ
ncbi:hypothetical protein SASPL_129888 [Salvia splendens]|uniref:Syntaxin 6/10/61 N-terminal domain-containing protein n=1 Tax=Salvia splendens TaxID=180675 RepID=A0A8X8XFU4_SALSN|nr:hypothetical protein SASPL_129888 [Salvia splendens]